MTNLAPGSTIYTDRTLRMARAAAGCREPSAEQLRIARHMAHAGATTTNLAEFFGWNVSRATLAKRLKKYNLRCATPTHQAYAHSGGQTSLPWGDRIDLRSYRAKSKEGA